MPRPTARRRERPVPTPRLRVGARVRPRVRPRVRRGARLGATAAVALALASADTLSIGPHPILGGSAHASSLAGAWSPVQPWPIVAIHAVLAPNGNLLTFGADGDSLNATGTGPKRHDTWNPRIGLHATVAQSEQDYFCSATVIVPDTSTILIGGGDDLLKGARGNALASYYDPATGRVEAGTDMNHARWYATATTLPDGRVLLQGGRGATNADAALTPEILDAGGWTDLPGATSFDAYGLVGDERRWWYPKAFVDPGGRVFTIAHSTMFTLDPANGGGLVFHGDLPDGHRGGATSTAVMYAPGRVLFVGGGAESNSVGEPAALASAAIVDITSGVPVVTPVAPMNHSRHWANATVLPNGQVLVNGGSGINNELVDVAYPSEIWDPVTRAWTVVATEDRARLYHSSAVLMGDGRVYSGGGGAPGPIANLDAQFFTPPYLFDSAGDLRARPVIEWAPPALAWGADFELRTANGDDVARVTLVKTGATTHSFNMDQRFVELDVEVDGERVRATAPAGSTVATPGYYLLSVIDADGAVSESRIVSLLGDTSPGDVERPPPDADERGSNPDGTGGGPADGGHDASPDRTDAPASVPAPVPSTVADAPDRTEGAAGGGAGGGCSVAGAANPDPLLGLLFGLGIAGAVRSRRRGTVRP